MSEAMVENFWQLPGLSGITRANEKEKGRDYFRVILRSDPAATNRSAAPEVSYNGTFDLKNMSFTKVTPTVSAEDSLSREFQLRAREWKKDTGFHSSLSEKFMHPAYQRIMAMGEAVLPFILRDLRDTSSHWFYALRFIVGEDIAKGTSNISEARDAWLTWGYKNGHI